MHPDPATMVPIIDALERHGHVQRDKDPSDGRHAPLALTESSASLLAHVPVFDRGDALIEGLSSLGDARVQELLQLLRDLASHMAPDADLARELASIAEMAREVFRSQAAAAQTDLPVESQASDTPDTLAKPAEKS